MCITDLHHNELQMFTKKRRKHEKLTNRKKTFANIYAFYYFAEP